MRALIGRKLGMAQQFNEDGTARAVTLVAAGPCTVTQIRTLEKDGYSAVQIGYGDSADAKKKLAKSLVGHLKPSGAKVKVLREVELAEENTEVKEQAETEIKVGDKLDVNLFEVGQAVTVSGTSKGKGFAGTIKRHNFHRGPKTHGSRSYRRPGSIGSMYPQKIWKGKKMAGQMGAETVTVKNLKIADINANDNVLAISGAIPGARGSLMIIRGL